MSCLKMYNTSPMPKGKTLPEGFSVIKYKGEEDIDAWIEICSDGLVDPSTARQRFIHELTEIDGPDPYRDTYFIEKDGKKVATYTVVPNMWSTGMGYLHMLACKKEYRGLGLGSFMVDDSLKKLVEIGKDMVFLLTGNGRIPAIRTYLKAGFLPVYYVDHDDGTDMAERWQNIVNILKIKELPLLDEKGEVMTLLRNIRLTDD